VETPLEEKVIMVTMLFIYQQVSYKAIPENMTLAKILHFGINSKQFTH
jgi:hypothetical protein